MKRHIRMTAALLLAAAATPASAQVAALGAADTADIQCFVVTTYMQGQYPAGSAEQAQMTSGMMHFLGRLEGRAPDTDWLKILRDYILEMDEARLSTELEPQVERCTARLQNRVDALVAWGASVSAAAQARGG